MSICCGWLDVLFQLRSSVCATRISLGLMINAGTLLASSRKLIFGGPVIALGLTGFGFGLSSSLPPLVSGGGGLVCESVVKADLLSDHFDGKQSRKSVDLSLTCHPSPSLTSFGFRSSEVGRLLLDLDPYGGSDPLGMFPLFLKRTADVLPQRLSVVFRRLVRLGCFPACWRLANVTPIQKGPPSSSVANYRLISIISLLSKVFERLVVRLGRFLERSGVLPTTQFAYRKGLGTCDALLCVSQTLQSTLESGQEARIVQIDFSAAFDRVNHQGILCCQPSLEVLCCLYRHSFYQIDHSTLWLTVVGVSWFMLCQEYRKAVFWANYCSSCTPRSFFPFWRIS